MLYLTCELAIDSRHGLEGVGNLISGVLLGGIPLAGREDHLCDEIPAIYTRELVMGHRVVLCGDVEDGVFLLELRREFAEQPDNPAGEPPPRIVDLSAHFARLLAGHVKVDVKGRQGPGLSCGLALRSGLPIEELGRLISLHVLGGVLLEPAAFVGPSSAPRLAVRAPLLGLAFVLVQLQEPSWFRLEATPYPDAEGVGVAGAGNDTVDLAELVSHFLLPSWCQADRSGRH